MRCHRRRRVTGQSCRNPLSPFGLRRHEASCCVIAPRRCSGIASRRDAWHLAPWHSQRDRLDSFRGLLESRT